MTKAKIFGCPGKYVQGYGVMQNLYSYMKDTGEKFLVIGTKTRLAALKDKVLASFSGNEDKLVFENFGGETTRAEIARIAEIADANSCDCIVGVGAGKTIDVARAIACTHGYAMVIVPTAAASDAPCSSVSVIYNEEGVLQGVDEYGKNPDMVLIDVEVIAAAGTRLLVAGMGDALATYFEARACVEAYKTNCLGGMFSNSSWELAKLCHRLLMESGLKAKLAVEKGLVTPAVEDIIEANSLLSGIGFESNGVAAAHGVYTGFTALPEHLAYLHGEFVSFGTICQLVLENRPKSEVDEVLRFCIDVGLPVSLADFKMENLSDEKLQIIADTTMVHHSSIHNEPFEVTASMVKDAILTADKIGQRYKSGGSL